MSEYYEVMYNSTYGGFRFPNSFVKKVFEKYPPDSEIGSKLFDKVSEYEHFISKDEIPNAEWNSYHLVEGRVPFIHGYNFLILKTVFKPAPNDQPARKSNYLTKNDKDYYFLTEYMREWRDSPEVIELAREYDLFNKCENLKITKVPKYFTYHVHEYDGMENIITEFPYRNIIQELLNHIDGKEIGELSELTKRLLDKKMSVADI